MDRVKDQGSAAPKAADERVAELRRAVQDGTYRVDPEATAAAMLKRARPVH